MKLSEFMSPGLVEMSLSAAGTEDVLRSLVSKLREAGVVKDGQDALRRLLEREKVMSTGIGGGIAIPHARSPEVSRTWVALGRSSDGVPFAAADGKPVQVVFLILGPPESSAEHVKVLGRIARLVKQPEFLQEVLAAGSAADALSAVSRYEEG